MVERAERYIDWLQRERIEIMIPAPVLAEYLAGATVQERHELEVFDLATEIGPFDANAARFAADLFRDVHQIEQMTQEYNVSKECIKIDIMLAAIAVTRNAQKIITHDTELIKILVKQRIPVESLPDIAAPGGQRSLF